MHWVDILKLPTIELSPASGLIFPRLTRCHMCMLQCRYSFLKYP